MLLAEPTEIRLAVRHSSTNFKMETPRHHVRSIVMGQALDQPKLLSLNVPNQLLLHVTPAQFAELAKVNRDLRLERTATGVLIVNPPTGGESGRRNLSMTAQLGIWFEANDRLGEAFDSSTGFELPNGANR